MVNSAVICTALRVERGGNTVLDGIELDITEGAITGLLGPSGCGKTTLMRAIIGTQRIESGAVTVLGRPAGEASLRREIGYASQQASVYDDLTVGENLRYFAVMVGAPAGDVDRVLDAVDLRARVDQLTGRMSGGQRSRVSLAVAMLGRPRVLVLDEPTVGLDPVLRAELWGLFARLAAEGMTLLVSSHVMDEAQRCDQLVLLRAGRVLTTETPPALMRRMSAASMDEAFLNLIRQSEALR